MINFKQIVSDWLKRRNERQAAQRTARNNRRASELVNVVEYNGELYVAYNAVPLVPIKELKGDVTKLLPYMRATFITWANTHNHVE